MGGSSPDETGREESHDPAAILIQKLIDEFAARLDGSLILAIASDRDIVKQFDEIRNDLLPLAESATAEEATGFDPSGLGHLTDFDALHGDDEALTSGNDTSQSRWTDGATTVSEASADLESPASFTSLATELSDQEKVESLQTIFNFEAHTIRFILKQCKGDLERAFDELINRQYLEESGELLKGVDGYAMPNGRTAGGSAKQRRAGPQQKSGRTTLHVDYSVTSPISDVEESDKDGDTRKRGASHRPASSPRSPIAPPLRSPVASSSSFVASQTRRPAVAANLQQPKPNPTAWNVVTKKKAGPKENSRPDDPNQALAIANYSRQAATSLARRGASDSLLRQGVVVYTERAREEFQVVKAQTSLEAERLVDSSSTPRRIDLHGVSVLDGVRIAKTRVWIWWERLGEDRARKAQVEGFTVVTGLGRHSVNGVSRLRQAVSIALKNDGWRVVTMTGEFYVTGRA